jgi:hypothetical protein
MIENKEIISRMRKPGSCSRIALKIKYNSNPRGRQANIEIR